MVAALGLEPRTADNELAAQGSFLRSDSETRRSAVGPKAEIA